MRRPTPNEDVVGAENKAEEDEQARMSSASRKTERDLDMRLERLSSTLKREERDRAEQQKPSSNDSAGFGLALRLASEFVAGILVGVALGWGIDRLAGTSPWGLIVFLMLGFVAGVFNVLRASGEMSKTGVELERKNKGLDEPANDDE